eukprot:3405700-Rhodomonas_salina.2
MLACDTLWCTRRSPRGHVAVPCQPELGWRRRSCMGISCTYCFPIVLRVRYAVGGLGMQAAAYFL